MSRLLGTTCKIRRAHPSDCLKIAYLAVQLGYDCTEEQVRERLREMQDSNQYCVSVAELPGGQIAGWVAVWGGWCWWGGGEEVEWGGGGGGWRGGGWGGEW